MACICAALKSSVDALITKKAFYHANHDNASNKHLGFIVMKSAAVAFAVGIITTLKVGIIVAVPLAAILALISFGYQTQDKLPTEYKGIATNFVEIQLHRMAESIGDKVKEKLDSWGVQDDYEEPEVKHAHESKDSKSA